MSKKSAKIGITYIVTILTTFLIMGGAGYFVMNEFLFSEDSAEDDLPDVAASQEEEGFSNAESKTLLVIFDAEKRLSGTCFMLIRFIPSQTKAMVMPIPSDTRASYDGREDSVYEFYRLSGTAGAVGAAQSASGVAVDNFIKLEKKSFDALVNMLGGVTYTIPYDIIYNNPSTGEETILREGESFLDADMLRQLLTYPEFRGGEEYRAKTLGMIAMDMLNKKEIRQSVANSLSANFNALMNSQPDTDITRYDFDEMSESLKHTLINAPTFAALVMPSGQADENGLFVYDENFVKSLKIWFAVDE